MYRYSENMQFESAAFIRDQINGLKNLQEEQKMIVPDNSLSRDVNCA